MTIFDTTSGKTITLDCGRLVRCIKGRRTVHEGLFGGKPVIIKCFTSTLQGKHHFKKEIHGFKELTLRNIKTAQIAAAGQNERGDHVIVLEKIENAVDIFSLLESASKIIDIQSVLHRVFECIAQMHTAGVLQPDLHTGNFLWNGQTIYVLDPAEMRFSKNPLDKITSFQQLGILFASLPKSFWTTQSGLPEGYFQSRGWPIDSSATEMLKKLTEGQRLKRIKRTLRKTLRTSKRYIQLKHGAYSGVFARNLLSDQNPLDFISKIDEQAEAGEILKRGNTCFVSRIRLNGNDVVVKRYNHKGLWHSLRHTLKGSRAKKCWLFGHRLNELGIATAKPVGFLEQRKAGLVWRSYILNEFIEGHNIQDHLNKPDAPDSIKNEISRKTRMMLDDLVHFKMTHGDLKASNILINQNGPLLIDLDSMKYHHCPYTLRRYQQKMNGTINERNILWKK